MSSVGRLLCFSRYLLFLCSLCS
uniref:Uncharacterized protein n=1 Tax=Rhizophora mucronata TaxID=61149 RepID=A0A2P2QU96_RHIMU